jgi:hypothetical protein
MTQAARAPMTTRDIVRKAAAETVEEFRTELEAEESEEELNDSSDQDTDDDDTPVETNLRRAPSTSDDEESQDETDEESETDDDDDRAKSKERSGPRAGVDKVLKILDETGDPTLGRAARDIIATNQTLQKANKELSGKVAASTKDFETYRQKFDALAEEVEQLSGGDATVREEDGTASVTMAGRDMLKKELGWRDTQIDGFTKALNLLGIETGEQKASAEIETARDNFSDTHLKRGIELFGEKFAVLGDDGEVVLNPEIAPKLRAKLQDMDEGMGVTPLDLYVLENFESLLTEAEQRGIEKVLAEDDETRKKRVSAARKGSGGVVRAGVRGGANRVKFDPTKGDTTRDVIRRARQLASEGR